MVAIVSCLNFTFNTEIQSEQVRLIPYFSFLHAVGQGNAHLTEVRRASPAVLLHGTDVLGPSRLIEQFCGGLFMAAHSDQSGLCENYS